MNIEIKEICKKCEENIHCQGKGCAFRSLGNEYCDEVENVNNLIKDLQKQNTVLKDNWNKLKEWLEEEIKENDTTIKKCDQIIFKMGNENRKDTHQHKLIDVCSRENLVFNRILSKMQEKL